uniref:Prefoldin subunit 1 n=4 Tax=Boreoeutheria TaxID=1437010 RepID=A0A7J7XCE2_PIPKU|nr:prefoldin subunit 1 [Pipistrellus kuhlii]
MAAPVDLELKKAFTELQAKVIDTQQKVKLADIQIEQLNRTKKHAHLTDTEIMTLVDETNMYEGVGRMFILQSKEVIHNQLLEKQKIAEEKIKELELPGEGRWEPGQVGELCPCPLLVMLVRPIKGICATLPSLLFLSRWMRTERQRLSLPELLPVPLGLWPCSFCIEVPTLIFSSVILQVNSSSSPPPWDVQAGKQGDQGIAECSEDSSLRRQCA